MVKSKLPARSASVALRQLNPTHKKGTIKGFFNDCALLLTIYLLFPVGLNLMEICSLIENDSKTNLVNIFLFKFNNRNTRKRCEIYSLLAIKTPERRQ